jgi:hypothetical protein
MRLPFGLDIKSVIVGILIAYFLIPAIQGMIARSAAPPAKRGA